MKTILAFFLCATNALAYELTMQLSTERVDPGDAFILSLCAPDSEPPFTLGASVYLTATADFFVEDRYMDFPDPTLPTNQLGTISSTKSADMGGSYDTDPVLTRIQLVLRAPTTPGLYYIGIHSDSVVLLPNWAVEGIPANAIQVPVAYLAEQQPEPKAFALLAMGCLALSYCRHRRLA